tara:strand:+ start:950 stop:2665 length:1716 start_codon:yes stop_codon:yes gene_type:complete
MAKLIEYNKKRLKGEDSFWNLINNEPFFNDWIVIWGLGISEHQRKLDGQSDFVLIGPLGIAVIEIKGGDTHIFKSNGGFEWGYSDSNKALMSSKETPFQQANGNMQSIKSFLEKNYPSRKKIEKTLFVHGAAFPEGDLSKIKNKKNIQFKEWEIWDSNSSDVKGFIINIFKKTEDKLFEIAPKFKAENLRSQEITHIIQYLSIEGKCVVKKNSENNIQNELIRLQDEQCKIYESDFKRICIDGGPGTGKSVVAQYIANKLILDQKKILWISFNRFFTESIGQKFAGNGFIDVKKSTQMALDICRKDGVDLDVSDPKLHEEFALSTINLLENNDIKQYDAIIWDEAQDSMTKYFFEGLEFLIKGGWENGSWYVFLDSNIQSRNLNRLDTSVLNKIKDLSDLKMPFLINYRNPKIVISHASQLANINTPECKSNIEGKIVLLKNESGIQNFLEDKVYEIISSGVRNPILLTYQKPENFIKTLNKNYFASLWNSRNIYSFRAYSQENKKDDKFIDYANVISFKGLECNNIILYWPLEYYESKYRSDIFYTALSRAFDKVYVILDNYEVDSKLIE